MSSEQVPDEHVKDGYFNVSVVSRVSILLRAKQCSGGREEKEQNNDLR